MKLLSKLLILISLIFFSCSPIRRHQRLVRKHPYVHTTDSVRLIDTVKIRTESVRIDTVVEIQALKDGVVVNKDNLKITARIVRDSFYLDGECDTIFINKIIERNIPVEYYAVKNPVNKTLLIWVIVLGAFILIWIFTKLK